MRARIKWRGARATAIALCAAGAAVMALLAPSISDAPAYANPSAGFDAGNIIDDALFYDGTAWNAAQIQSFLNQRVPRCTIGDPGRGAYTPWGSTMISGACLGGSFWTTAARPANAYCSAMAGAVNESAASYIARVGAACGISPKVLLVMLEKEQSLVTDTWPTVRQYDFAMGYDCPDSGPNNSPNCNNGAGGFPAQMYRGAWQLKVYKAFPNSYNYRPFQNNRIQWHPNAGCGTSDVWIANWATAALYIYTPYRPNQAALNAGWGTGDSCSSYGNRNFYNFYTSWFGSAQGVQVSEYFTAFHTSNGGLSGLYGRPLQVAQPVGIGVVQEFSGGTLYWNPYTGVGGVNGAIRDYYRVVGGPFGVLGYPIGRENAVSGGASQRFERGYVYWSSPYGSQPVGGAILPLYTSEGGPAGYLGFPTGGERPVTGGVKQEFERGTAYWSNRTGASVINGAIRGLYLSEGGPDGYLGLPVGAEVRANGVSRQEFERGTAYWSNGTGASVINGAIRGLYLSEGGPDGYLGLPVGAEVRANGVSRQEFERGTAYWSNGTGASVINGAIRGLYLSEGGPDGYLGLPVGAEVRANGVSRQEFERGTAYWSNRTGASVINGAIRGLYLSEGGPDGYLGLPVGAEVRANGVSRQEFERGTAYWSNRTGASVINGAIRSWYLAHGGPSGSLGLPVGPEIRSGGVSRQEFERGALTWSASEGVREVPASVTASAPASLAVPPVAKAEDETTASQ